MHTLQTWLLQTWSYTYTLQTWSLQTWSLQTWSLHTWSYTCIHCRPDYWRPDHTHTRYRPDHWRPDHCRPDHTHTTKDLIIADLIMHIHSAHKLQAHRRRPDCDAASRKRHVRHRSNGVVYSGPAASLHQVWLAARYERVGQSICGVEMHLIYSRPHFPAPSMTGHTVRRSRSKHLWNWNARNIFQATLTCTKYDWPQGTKELVSICVGECTKYI